MKKSFVRILSIMVMLVVLSVFFGVPQMNTVWAAADTTVTVDTANILESSFMGFKTEMEPYYCFPPSSDEYDMIFKRVNFMMPSTIRCMLKAFYYCTGWDESGEPIYDWNTYQMQRLYEVLDFWQLHGVDVIIGEWGIGSFYDVTLGITDWNDPRWVRIIGDFLDEMINVKGYTCIKYYNFTNEPNHHGGLGLDWTKWKANIESLYDKLVQKGLQNQVKIVGPDSVSNNQWVYDTVDQLSDKVGIYQAHRYPLLQDLDTGILEQQLRSHKNYMINAGKNKQYFLGELGIGDYIVNQSQTQINTYDHGVWMGDAVIQLIRAGLAGASAWALDDSIYVNNATLQDNYGCNRPDYQLKKFGFWNTLGIEEGNPSDENLRPWYYVWSLCSRYFPEGSQTLNTSATGFSDLRVASAKIQNGGNYDYTFAVVNRSDTARTVRIVVPGAPTVNLTKFNYFVSDRPVDVDGFPVSSGTLSNVNLNSGFDVSLPSKGVVILSSYTVVPWATDAPFPTPPPTPTPTPAPDGTVAFNPVEDAYIAGGSYGNINYGTANALRVKDTTSDTYNRKSYLKFDISSIDNVASAKLRIYGSNSEDATSVNAKCYGVDTDSWSESGITWNSAPANNGVLLGSVDVNNMQQYYEFDVTNYVQSQVAGDKIVTLQLTCINNENKNLIFNSKEAALQKPELFIQLPSPTPTPVSTLFNDDFEDGDSNGWSVVSGTWGVVDDSGNKVYRQSGPTAIASRSTAGDIAWKNYSVESKIKFELASGVQNRNVGLYGRYTDENNYYMTCYNSYTSTIYLTKRVTGGEQEILASKSTTLNPNTPYTFKFELNGSSLKFYINGVEELAATDTTFASGKIGLYTYNQTARFDDVSANKIILINDDFEDGDSNGWSVVSGTWGVVDDSGNKVYRQSGPTALTSRSTAGDAGWTDNSVEAKIKFELTSGVQNRNVGLYGRYTDENNYYMTCYNSYTNTIYLTKRLAGGEQEILASKSTTLSPNTPYTFKFELIGNSLKFYINGVEELAATDTTFASGKIGLYTYNQIAKFDEILVTK